MAIIGSGIEHNIRRHARHAQRDIAAPATIVKRSVPAAPHFVIYADEWQSGQTRPPAASQLTGWNTFILSFLMINGAADQALLWEQISASTRAAVKAEYAAAGISLMVSAFGSTDAPTSNGADAAATARSMAAWVKKYDLDGIDVDYEDFNAINAGNGKAEQWLITFTQTLRDNLPAGQYIITHAPVAPWFSKSNYPAGAYAKVFEAVGNDIDWFNVQFYNQAEYTNCAGLLTKSSNAFPKSSIFEIHETLGVPLNKLVIGKPSEAGMADNGYMAPALLASCVQQAKSQGWNAGIMAWEYTPTIHTFISASRLLAFPISGGGGVALPHSSSSTAAAATSTATARTQSAKFTTSTSVKATGTASSAASTETSKVPSDPINVANPTSCNGVKAWSKDTVYWGEDKVTYSGKVYTAKWWTEGDVPGAVADQWERVWVPGTKC